MTRRWTRDHGRDELYDKFVVAKRKDIRILTGAGCVVPNDKRIGADGEFVFVLRPETDFAAWLALVVYAGAMRTGGYPNLAREIDAQCDRIAKENGRS